MTENRGSVGFSSTYRPPLPLDIFSSPETTVSKRDEVHMSDGVSYNYNGREIPSPALKTILKRPIFTNCGYDVNNVGSGGLTGMVFVSERDSGLETVHIAIRSPNGTIKVFSVADVFGTFNGIRMEDTSSVAVGGGGGDYLIYITTKDPSPARRQPWTAVYKTNLTTGETTRLTPIEHADLSPSLNPSGTKIAVASFEGKTGGWDGEIEDLITNIYVMNVEEPFERTLVVKDGGWPTWGSDNVLFFHRKGKEKDDSNWRVFKAANIDGRGVNGFTHGVTPKKIDAMTPAAISATKVAVATIRKKSGFHDERTEEQYRHIEIFEQDATTRTFTSQTITQKITPKADHFNPFVIDSGKRIGYHRCKSDQELKCTGDTQKHSNKLASPHPDVGLFRMPGIFPTFSKDGSKLAFVDNNFTNVWVADSKGLRIVYTSAVDGRIFSPVWNQDPKKDILYVNSGLAFSAENRLDIIAIPKVSEGNGDTQLLTKKGNNAFPSTNPDGTKLVFRSTVDLKGNVTDYKNLYIMHDVHKGEYGGGIKTSLTVGEWTDTHCQWSPSGDWIVFSSSRDKPKDKLDQSDNGLDPGYFGVYLVKADDPNVCVRVTGSGSDGAGHVNHPFFSPDGMSIVVASDLAGVSADPISLPLFLHSVRPYGDIFIIDIDPDNIYNNKEVKSFRRITHSRYENSTASWTMFSTEDPKAEWNQLLNQPFASLCPTRHSGGGETWYNTGQLWINPRCC